MEKIHLHEVTESVPSNFFHSLFAESANQPFTAFTSERQRHRLPLLVRHQIAIKGTHWPALIQMDSFLCLLIKNVLYRVSLALQKRLRRSVLHREESYPLFHETLCTCVLDIGQDFLYSCGSEMAGTMKTPSCTVSGTVYTFPVQANVPAV